jgi:23S rRNA pseudouridine1911/1915/1917 synthase
LNAGFEYVETLPLRAQGCEVLDWLAARWLHSTREEWSRRIDEGRVTLDGAVARKAERVRAGQRLAWARPAWVEPEAPLRYDVVFEDEHLLVVDKPSGLPTMPGGDFHQNTLLALVRRRDPKWTPVHRLGRGTSGLLAFGAGPAAALHRAFRDREVVKRYLARVTGALQPQTITAPIGPVPHARLGTLHAVSPAGRPATTVVERVDGELAQVRIVTGRPHQIRIHLAYAGHPLLGDPLYAEGGALRDAVPGDCGYSLHAWQLSFRHPVTGVELRFEARPPPG